MDRAERPRRSVALEAKMAADRRRHAGKFGLVHAGLGNVSRHFAQRDKIRTASLSRIRCESYLRLLLNVQPSVFCSKVGTRAGLPKHE